MESTATEGVLEKPHERCGRAIRAIGVACAVTASYCADGVAGNGKFSN